MKHTLRLRHSLALAAMAIFMLLPGLGWGQIAAWDFNGVLNTTSLPTYAATTFNTNLVSTSNANLMTRGATAAWNGAGNSFRTVGFKNEGIATSNTDYFQITLTAATGYVTSLSTIDAKLAGTASFCVSPGVDNQFAFSLDGTTFTLIGTSQALIGTPATLTQINLSGIPALQGVAAGTTITLRYYASGRTITGGWGFISATAGSNGLAIGGTVTPAGAINPPSLSPDITLNDVDNNIDITFTDNPAWRAASPVVKIGGTALTVTTDYVFSAGNLQLKPSGGNPLLTVSGLKAVTVEATGYNTASVTQVINAGAAAKLVMKTQPTDPITNGGVLATQPAVYIQDQYSNATTSTASVSAAVGAGTWTIGGTASVAGIAGTVTFSGLTATSTAAVTGATIAFTSAGLTGITSGTFNIAAPPAQIDWANLQYPASAIITLGDNFDVYAQVYEPGVTDAGSPGAGITAWIGYSTTNTDPSTWTNWVAATFNTDAGNNDEYKANIGAALTASGTIYYASRFQLGTALYVYGGYNSGFWNGTTNVSGVLTVNEPNQIDWANLQSPATGTIILGGAFNAYAQVYEPGLTNPAGQGAGITAWIGYSTTNTNPNSWTNWVPATYNTDFGNNDEYTANIGAAIGTVGTYYYASRFKLGLATYVYGGYNGGFWDGTTSVSGVLTVNPVPVPAAVVNLRPSYIDIASATSESAVLMTLSNYSTNDVRFRLYNGSNQYNCWDETTDAYISSLSYNVGPQVPGTPMTSTNFWIVSQRGNNATTVASYRDRLGPTYPANFLTAALPLATSITTPFTLSGGFAGNISYSNSVKHVVLAYSGATLISAAATTLNNGLFAVVCPVGTTIDKIEIRAINNTLIETLTGSWAATTDVGTFPNDITTFTGTGNWSSAGSWSQGIPTYFKKAIIDGSVIVDVAAEAYTLGINSGSSVTINPNSSLKVFSTLTNNAGATSLVVKSGGSLIEYNGVSATVERNITADVYHSFSPSVGGLTANLFHLPGSTGLDVYLYSHNELLNGDPGSGFFEISSVSTPLVAFAGYSVYLDGVNATPPVSSWTFIEQGSLNTGTFGSASNMTRTGAGDNTSFAGFNYIGNPYPSFINWTSGSWTKTNIDAAIYVENSGSWASYASPGPGVNSGSNILAPGQGFFVRVSSGQTSGTVIMNNNVRTQTSTPYLKSSPTDYVRLIATGNGKSDETVVRFDEAATSNYDGQFDAAKLGVDDASIPQIYSVADAKLAYNALPSTDLVQLGFTASVSGEYTIAINAVDGIALISLEDTQTGTFTDLTKNSYTFNAAPGDAEQRFVLHFGPMVSINEAENAVASIYTNNGILYVDLKNNAKGDIYVYTVAGQLVAKVPATQGSNKISLVNTGNYIVKVISDRSMMVRKVFIH